MYEILHWKLTNYFKSTAKGQEQTLEFVKNPLDEYKKISKFDIQKAVEMKQKQDLQQRKEEVALLKK